MRIPFSNSALKFEYVLVFSITKTITHIYSFNVQLSTNGQTGKVRTFAFILRNNKSFVLHATLTYYSTLDYLYLNKLELKKNLPRIVIK